MLEVSERLVALALHGSLRLVEEDEALGLDRDAGLERVVQVAERRRFGDLGFDESGLPVHLNENRCASSSSLLSGPDRGPLKEKAMRARKKPEAARQTPQMK